jgi:hypothetical protein
VICITSGDFTLIRHFCKLFEALTATKTSWRVAFYSPYPLKLYTKAAAKANPGGPSQARVPGRRKQGFQPQEQADGSAPPKSAAFGRPGY